MPTYQYICEHCKVEYVKLHIPVQMRDEQKCDKCENFLSRQIVVTNVSVWAPTSGGYK